MFKVSKEDDKHYVLTHKDGHFMKIAKKGLSPETLGHIKKLCGGGSVGMADGGQVNPKLQQSKVRNMADGGEVDDTTPSVADEIPQAQQEDLQPSNDIRDMKNSIQAKPSGKVPMKSGRGPDWDKMDEPTEQSTQPQNNVSVNETPNQNQDLGARPQSQNQQPNPMVQANANALAQSQGIQNQLIGAQQGIANVQGKTSQETLNALQNQQEEYNNQAQRIDENMAGIQKHIDDTADGVRNFKIDPKRAWNQKSTADKGLALIGVILGGIGSSWTGGRNLALDQINKTIDNDIASQEKDLGNQKTALDLYLREYGNMKDAKTALRLNYMTMIDTQTQMAAARNGSEVAKYNAMNNSALIKQQMLPMQQQLATSMAAQQMASQAGAGQNIERLVPLMVPEKHQSEVFKEIKQAQSASKNHDFLMKQFDQASNENTILRTGFGKLRTPPSILAMEANELPMIHDTEGRVNEFEKDTLDKLHPAPGDTDAKVAEKRKAYEKFLTQKMEMPTAKGYGLPTIQVDKVKSRK